MHCVNPRLPLMPKELGPLHGHSRFAFEGYDLYIQEAASNKGSTQR